MSKVLHGKMRFKKGDKVIITTGKDKGTIGTIQKVFPATRKLTVEGVNTTQKRLKPNMQNPYPQTITVERPIDSSNVSHLDPKANIATKIGYRFENGKKVRFAKKSQELIDIL